MSWQMWTIIGLLVLSWSQYTYPDKVKSITDGTWGSLNNYMHNNNIMRTNSSSSTNTNSNVCPATVDPVCGNDGKTYDNICKATMANVVQVTPGACA